MDQRNYVLIYVCNPFDYVQLANVNLQMEQFTSHGMHTNRYGKDLTARHLAKQIVQIFVKSHSKAHISLKWGNDNLEEKDNINRLTERKMLSNYPKLEVDELSERSILNWK
jgi:hypothetical protein